MSKKTMGIILIIILIIIGLAVIRRHRLNKISSSSISNITSQSTSGANNFGLKAGDYDYTIKVGNANRRYLLHVPANYDAKKNTPLILAFHGGLGDAQMMADDYGLKEKSDKEGFIVAFPNGASRLPSGKLATWNAGNCCGYAKESQSADTDFVKATIDDIKSKFNIGKIFATGMSNGGMLSHRLACEMSDTFSAIAAISGTNNFDGCNPQKPISILHIHGLQDDHVLFNGGCGPKCIVGSETQYISVPKTIADWVQRNKCDATPQRIDLNANAYCDLYTGCTNNVQVKLCVAKDGGHSWPGTAKAPNPLEKSIPSQSINANDEIWNFFKANL